ncbi:hypothetical protein C9374_011145 [Naegleria lovaniensis]|uniref:Endonuclease/exonuclease/phosphatase domain-containing protein n=1 Tax=Naegleria lovaniensis TaxID=51637 RepID=A0AA88GCM7_NAELO|nr:uncharacterized protein C9374_011145 [Naegleria lovaniensis]KAG2374066.1 hypothetical protein C9374_011145 [Naegleria lovaniensis]
MQQIPVLRFCTLRNEWEEYLSPMTTLREKEWKSLQISPLLYPEEENGLKIGTFNIMAEIKAPIKNSIVRDVERFHYTIELLKRENFDVLGLNEVTPEFLLLLQQNTFFQEHYFFSDIVEESQDETCLKTRNTSLGRNSQGNLILSKYPPLELFKLEDPIVKPVLFCTFSHHTCDNQNNDSDKETLCIISAHTSAYSHNVKRREVELVHITQQEYLNRMDEVILMGDLNIHLDVEEKTIELIQYEDLWNETHDSTIQKGFTFDSYLNTFIRCKYLGMEIRRMRLDRILIRKSPHRRMTAQGKMELFANEPLCQWKQSSSSFSHSLKTPLWWKAFHSLKLACQSDYLFCSDHFGLKVTLKKFENSNQMERHVKEMMKQLPCVKDSLAEDENVQPYSNHRRVFLTYVVIVVFSAIIFRFLFM